MPYGKWKPLIAVRGAVRADGFAAEVGKQTAFAAVRWAAPAVYGAGTQPTVRSSSAGTEKS